MKGPKVVLIGAGSMFFGRQCIWAMTHSEVLKKGTLSLVDTDTRRLSAMTDLARLAIRSVDAPLKLESSVDRRMVLKDADFVVLSFANRGVHFRGVDCAVSEKYGIRMCSGDTIGPGGIFRAARELPEILRVASDIEKICPDAWVINYINPTAVNGLALARHAPKLKSFALCDGLHMPHVKHQYMNLAGLDGMPEQDFDITIAGVNHFTWLLKAQFRGEDVTPKIRASMEALARCEHDEGQSKRRFNNSYALQLWDIYGRCPTCIAHTKEYVPFWQGKGVASEAFPPLSIFDTVERERRHAIMWEEVARYRSDPESIGEFHKNHNSDHATDVIEAMWSGAGGPFYINTLNKGAVGNLPEDSFVELLSDVSMEGPVPRDAGQLPLGLRSMQMQVLDTHELTVEAIVRKDHGLLRRAMFVDPIVNSIGDADAVIDELLEKEADALEFNRATPAREPVLV